MLELAMGALVHIETFDGPYHFNTTSSSPVMLSSSNISVDLTRFCQTEACTIEFSFLIASETISDNIMSGIINKVAGDSDDRSSFSGFKIGLSSSHRLRLEVSTLNGTAPTQSFVEYPQELSSNTWYSAKFGSSLFLVHVEIIDVDHDVN